MAAQKAGQILDKIYEAIENGKYSEGVRLCQLPEVNKLSLPNALQAYCHSCMRQTDTALTIARAVATRPNATEEAVLNALACTFKACRAEGDYAAVYENLIKTPSGLTEKNLCELFFCYNRQREPKKMQMTAQRMYKLTDNPKYLFWSTSALLMQRDLPPAMLVVAEKTLRKVLYEQRKDKCPGAEELQLFLSALVRQGRLKDALDELKTLSARPRDESERLNDEEQFSEQTNLVAMQALTLSCLKLDLLVHLRDWGEVERECLAVLESLPDQWAVYDLLHQLLLFRLGALSPWTVQSISDLVALNELPKPVVSGDSLPSMDREMHARLVAHHLSLLRDKQRANPKLRGPRLAELHLLLSLAKHSLEGLLPTEEGVESDVFARLLVLFEQYVTLFESKYCCFMDLKPLLHEYRNVSLSRNGQSLQTLWTWLRDRRTDACTSAVEELKKQLGLSVSLAVESVVAAVAVEEEKKSETVTETVAEGESEDEDEQTNAASTTATSNTSSSKKKSKKRAKKKKSPATPAVTPAQNTPVGPELKRIDRDGIQRVLQKEETAVVRMCVLCQLDSLESLVFTLLGEDRPRGDREDAFSLLRVSERNGLFSLSQRFFAGGIGGEKRIVQPGDDLLLLNSAAMRRDCEGERERLLQWLTLLVYGTERSPFSHNLKLDLLEVCQRLGLGELAWSTYQSLGAKNVQHDSMSYLVTHTLTASGHWGEASRQLRAVINAQSNSRREALDMMSRAFDYANYNKVFEIYDFAEASIRSVQLVAAKAELAVLEVAQCYFEDAPASLYLQGLRDGKHPESLDALTQSDVDALVSHLDFSLAQRLHSTPQGVDVVQTNDGRTASTFERERDYRNAMVKLRIVFAQRLVDYWRAVLFADGPSASLSPSPSEASLSLIETIDSLSLAAEQARLWRESHGALAFDQNAFAFAGADAQTRLLRAAVCASTELFVPVIAGDASVLTASLTESEREIVKSLDQSLLEITRAMSSSVCVTLELSNSLSPLAPTLVDAERLESLSFFLRNTVPWVSLAVQSLMSRFARYDDAAGNCKAVAIESVNGSPVEANNKFQAFWRFVAQWVSLLRKVKATLRDDIARLSASTTIAGGAGSQWWAQHLQRVAASIPDAGIDASVSSLPYTDSANAVSDMLVTSFRQTLNTLVSQVTNRESAVTNAHKKVMQSL